MIGRVVRRITRKGAGVAVQAVGAAAVVVAVGMLVGIAWAVGVAGVALLVGGTLAEAG